MNWKFWKKKKQDSIPISTYPVPTPTDPTKIRRKIAIIRSCFVQAPGEIGERVASKHPYGLSIKMGSTSSDITAIRELLQYKTDTEGEKDPDFRVIAFIYGGFITDIEWEEIIIDGNGNKVTN